MNGGEDETLHQPHGEGEFLLLWSHLQVMEKIPRLHPPLLGAIALIGLKESIWHGSPLGKLHQSSKREARMLPSLPMMGHM